MLADNSIIKAKDLHRIYLKKWFPAAAGSNPPKAIVHICHGMAEHCQRYHPIAEELVAAGYVVFGHDHRGHGHSIAPGSMLGHFADTDGWEKVIEDVFQVNQTIQVTYPGTPVVLLGHSMGAFIALAYSLQHGDTISGVVLSGCSYNSPATLMPSQYLIKLECRLKGPLARSWLINQATFGRFNRQFKNTQTDHDWLTRDTHEVQKYSADPLCGFLCTNQLWLDFIGGLQSIAGISKLLNIPNHLPFLLLSGERDPLSYHRLHHGVKTLAKKLSKAGQTQVDYKLYPDGRHEIFNEINRAEVISDLINWLDQNHRNNTNPQRQKQLSTEFA